MRVSGPERKSIGGFSQFGFPGCLAVELLSLVLWYIPVIPVLKTLRQENTEFKDSLNYLGGL